MKRWEAVVTYRSEKLGKIDVTHQFEELEELHDLVECGPDWNTIENIVITLSRRANYNTLEEASLL